MKHILFILLALMVTFASAQDVSERKLTEYLEGKIESKTINSAEKFKVTIMMKDGFDYESVYAKKSSEIGKKAQRAVVVNEFKTFTKSNQANVLLTLNNLEAQGEVANIRQLWIVNAVTCEATITAILQIAQRQDVQFIDYDLRDCFIPEPVEKSSEIVTKSDVTVAENVVRMKAPEVWAMGYEGEGIVVGIIDTGVNYEHSDLQGNLWDGGEEFPNHGWNFDEENNNPNDVVGHGTHCAGTVLGNGASGTKTGVAPKAKIMILKALQGVGSGTSQACAWLALEFAVENGADLVTGSFSVPASQRPNNTAWRQAFDGFLAAGLIATIASGNEYGNNNVPENVGIPGKIPAPWIHLEQIVNSGGISSVLTVGAVDEKNIHATFSSAGPVTWQTVEGYKDYAYRPGIGLIKPDITAPGVNITSLDSKNVNGYRLDSGTSMATPGVAGVVALMLSKNRDLTPAEIAEILQVTAVKLTDKKSNLYGSGLVDAYQAVLRVKGGVYPEVVKISGDKKITMGNSATMDVTVKNITGVDVNGLKLEISTESPFVTFENNTATLATVTNDGSASLEGIFPFTLSNKATGITELQFIVTISDTDGKKWLTSFVTPVASAKLKLVSVKVDDSQTNVNCSSNGILEEGEQANLIVKIRNESHEKAIITGGTVSCGKDDVSVGSYSFAGEINADNGVSLLTIPITNVAMVRSQNIDNVVIPFHIELTDASGVVLKEDFEILENKLKAVVVDKSGDNSSQDIVEALKVNGYAVDVVTKSSDITNINNYSSAWFIMGSNLRDQYVSEVDEWQMKDFLSNGGKIYLEGVNTWGNDNSAALDLFNIRKSSSQSSITSMVGVGELSTEGLTFNYKASANQTYRLSPLNDAFPILKNTAPDFNTAIASVSDYTTIGATFSFKTVIEPENTHNTKGALLSRMLEQMDLPSSYCEAVQSVQGIEKDKKAIISWSEPYRSKTKPEMYPSLAGYIIHRDGETLTKSPITELTFEDTTLGKVYSVTAIYRQSTSKAITVTLNTDGIDDASAESIKLYPNPAKNTLHIDGDFESVELISVTGQIIYKSGQTQQIDITSVNNGVYIARIIVNGTKVVNHKITINK